MHTVFILLGANLGDRVNTLQQASNLIESRIGNVTRASALYETAAWGLTDQPSFLNQVLLVETREEPEEVLNRTQAIEQALGRVRHEKWGARLIDVDLLYYDQYSCQTDRLTIPHPYLHVRRFTLVPLAEIAPDFVHPLLHQTNQALLDTCTDTSEVVRMMDFSL